jgi:hypothetical protein
LSADQRRIILSPEVKGMVGIEGLYYAGNHGLEIEDPV